MKRRTAVWGWLALLAALGSGVLGPGLPIGPRADEPLVTVVDGDTLEVGGRTVDLAGIDAPELGQVCRRDGQAWHCGVTAAQALRKLIDFNRGQITCAPWEDDRPGTGVVCRARHEDVAEVMLREGYAVATPHGPPSYAEAQREAEVAGLGVWGSRFVPPASWRRGERLPSPSGAPLDELCNVKGTISAGGERIYYVPTDPGYPDVELDPSKGETMLCSDEAARARGWHRPGDAGTRAHTAALRARSRP